jgi:hypothetical protein
MNQIKNEKYTDAMELLKPVSRITYEQIDTLASKMNYQLPYFIYRFGKIIGVDLIENKTIKDFLIQRTYVLRFEKYYARFEFILYKNLVGWAVLGFKYDDNISSLFK